MFFFLPPIKKIAQRCERLKLPIDKTKKRNRLIGAFFSYITHQLLSVKIKNVKGKAMQYEVPTFTPWLRKTCGVLDILSDNQLPNGTKLDEAIYDTCFPANSPAKEGGERR